MRKEDITKLSFGDDSFDVIICIHVLEHVEDDRRAMSEMLRVLKNDGFAILNVPIDVDRERTYEDPEIKSPEERARAFGQYDHVRLYGRDFSKCLEEVGFEVRVDQFSSTLDRAAIKCHGLGSTPWFFCTRKRQEQNVRP